MTFSIVARDPRTGAFGVATATAGPAVGALVPHVRAGFGAAATQAMTNPYLAIDALAGLDEADSEEALRAAIAQDAAADRRQAIIVDNQGRTAAWTGAECLGFAGHIATDDVAVAGNLLTGPRVLEAMLAGFHADADTGLAGALLSALQAGASAGGDSRGLGSAALRVQGHQGFADVDLRVDLSDAPLDRLAEVLRATTTGSYAQFFAEVPRR